MTTTTAIPALRWRCWQSILALLSALGLLGGGCKSTAPATLRSAHRDSFLVERRALAEAVADGRVLDLATATKLALQHNLELRLAETSQRLAKLDRQAVFSYFLPQVDLRFTHTQYGDAPAMASGGKLTQTGDQNFSRLALAMQQPILAPQAWYLYSMKQRGEVISGLLLARIRQLIELEVAVRYFDYLASQDMELAIRQAIAEAQQLNQEVSNLCERGMAMPSQRLQAETALLARQMELRNNQRDQRAARAALLQSLGLLPLTKVEFSYADIPAAPVGDLAELLSQALLNRLELQIADQSVELARTNVRRAVAAFLPDFALVAGYSYNTDSFLAEAGAWSGGIAGVLSVFDGFRNLAEYRAAKVQREAAFLAREQRCFAILLEVVRAHTSLAKQADLIAVAEKNLTAETLHLRETRARAREGLLPPSDLLEAVAATDLARTRLTIAKFQLQVAALTLRHAVEVNPFP